MGQHLQLYTSKTVTLEEAQIWAKWRAIDILKEPPPGSDEERAYEKVRALMNVADKNNFEHGSKGAVQAFDFLVMAAREIDAELIRNVCDATRMTNLSSDHMIDWLCQHYGQVVWGDNDGV
jgi:hypothetical protein